MKFTTEKGLGRRPTRPKSQELLMSVDEPKEQGPFPWFDPIKHAQLIHEVQSNIPDTPPNLKDFYQAKFELAYFLSVLCANHPDLMDLTDKQIKEAAQKAYKETGEGELVPLGMLSGVIDSNIRRKIRAESITRIQGRMEKINNPILILMSNNLEVVFSLRLVAPDKVRWVARGIHTNPLEYGGDVEEPGQYTIPAAAKLSVIWPERKGEFLRAITPEHVQQFSERIKELERKVTGKKAELGVKALWAESIFYQQILAAESIQITPDGQIQLQAPTQPIRISPNLPERTVL